MTYPQMVVTSATPVEWQSILHHPTTQMSSKATSSEIQFLATASACFSFMILSMRQIIELSSRYFPFLRLPE